VPRDEARPATPRRVYLDHNATTPPSTAVLDAMREAAGSSWANPSSIHADGRAARAVVEHARARVAELAGRDPRDVILTSGGTEANNLALRSAFPAEPAAHVSSGSGGRPPGWLLTSRLEHPSVTRVAEALEQEGRARVRWLAVTPEGLLDTRDLDAALEEIAGPPALVTLQAVNHETGMLQPVAEVARRVRAAGGRLHVDAVQAWGKVDTRDVALADSASLAAHKIHGPKGIGALVGRTALPLSAVLLGGAQERGIRPGTLDAVLAAGLGAAVEAALGNHVHHAAIAALRDRLEAGLLALQLVAGGRPRVAGDPARRAPHVTTTVWPGWAGVELVAALDLEGISVSSGAACSAGTVEPSPVLTAMLGAGPAASGIRASLGRATTADDVAFALEAFRRVAARA